LLFLNFLEEMVNWGRVHLVLDLFSFPLLVLVLLLLEEVGAEFYVGASGLLSFS
jgi:hypothetical protein